MVIGEKEMTWRDIIKLLRKLGYSEPHHYNVCLSKDHAVLLDPKSIACEVCSKPRQDCIDYYVLGLGFSDWFCTEDRCEQLMSHWRKKIGCMDLLQVFDLVN